MDALIGGKANVVIQKSNFYHISKIFHLKKKKKTFGSTFRTEWTIGGLIYIYIYIYIYKTEAFEASTIFHVSTIFKYNIKTK